MAILAASLGVAGCDHPALSGDVAAGDVVAGDVAAEQVPAPAITETASTTSPPPKPSVVTVVRPWRVWNERSEGASDAPVIDAPSAPPEDSAARGISFVLRPPTMVAMRRLPPVELVEPDFTPWFPPIACEAPAPVEEPAPVEKIVVAGDTVDEPPVTETEQPVADVADEEIALVEETEVIAVFDDMAEPEEVAVIEIGSPTVVDVVDAKEPAKDEVDEEIVGPLLVSIVDPETGDAEDISVSAPTFVDEVTPLADGARAASAMIGPPPPAITDAVIPTHRQNAWFGMVRGAYELADRGACYAAKAELSRTLYEIAQTKDVMSGGSYTACLAQGLRALDEAADFVPAEGAITPVATEITLTSHQTPIAHVAPANLPPSALMQRYHAYAAAQLGEAVGGVRAGSMSLHAIGKLYARLAELEGNEHRDAADRAITFQRAALQAHTGNHLAANELGVLLARSGNFASAERMILHSIGLVPTDAAQHNLQVVRVRLAQSRGAPASVIPTPPVSRRVVQRPSVEWVPVERFARNPITNRSAPRRVARNVPATRMQPAPPRPNVAAGRAAVPPWARTWAEAPRTTRHWR